MNSHLRDACVYPEDLLDFSAPDDCDRRWWVVYTKSRQEKALARDLCARRIPFYLPVVAKDNLIRRRRVRSYVPVFGGYVFLYGDESERVRSLTTNRVSRILEVSEQEHLRHDLRQINRLIETDAPLTVERRLPAGHPVRIKAGSMSGLEGTIVSRQGRTRLVIAVNFLQQGASVEIEDFLVEPI